MILTLKPCEQGQQESRISLHTASLASFAPTHPQGCWPCRPGTDTHCPDVLVPPWVWDASV